MANIAPYLADILAAVYGEQVRGSIHDAIKIINDVGEKVFSTGTEITGPTSSSEGYFVTSLYLNIDTMELWKCTGTNAWTSLGILKGSPGEAGEDGVGIESILKAATVGLVDTYTITYTDGGTDTFTVTNGADGTNGVSVTGVSLIDKVGLLATYRMSFSDGTYFDYSVSDGASGSGTGDMTKAVYDTNNNGIVDAAETLQGLTASITELNYMRGVTSAVQDQLNSKANASAIPTVDQAYNASSANAQSGTAVKQAIDALDVSDSAVSGKYVSAVSETNGKISVTRENLPSIPTVNNGQLTIQQNGTNKATFTANQSGNATANIITGEYIKTASVSNGSVTFTGVDDSVNSGGCGYDVFFDITSSSTNKSPYAKLTSISGEGTSNCTLTYQTDADDGTNTAHLYQYK